jgi:two-component system KDP operon response regulator KdpE
VENTKVRILVIDDEPQIRKLLSIALNAHNFHFSLAENGVLGIQEVACFKPDLVLLDLSLPDIDGVEVIKRIREWSQVPILILSVRNSDEDKVEALDAGADDFLVKPFSMNELFARIRAALRHITKNYDNPVLEYNGIKIDCLKRQVFVDGIEVKLTPTEYEILKVLLMNFEKVVTQKQLLQTVWGSSYNMETHYLRIYLRKLRKKIEQDPSNPKHLITESGIGYRLI